MLRKLLTSAMVFLITAGVAFAQSGTIKGTVTDQQTGETVVGANVYIQSINKGAPTDVNGKFTIQNLPYDTYQLRISFVGYDTKMVPVTVDQSIVNVNVQLVENVSELGEVIVTAFGISENKRSVPFQSKQLSSDEINVAAAPSPAEGLVGKVAGLQINHQSSGVKPENQILLRGLRSISGNNEPLVVIDGSKASLGAFRDLNSQDIKNINVLKGATSAALYGSDASNGALIVTTKNGKGAGKLTVGYRNSTTWKDVAYMPDFQSKFGQGIDRVYNPIENTNWGPRFDGQERRVGPDFPDSYPVDDQYVTYDKKEDNLKDFYNTGNAIQNTIYFSGGDDTGSFYLSLGNNNTTGVIPDNKYEKYTFTANGSKTLGDITLGVNATYFTDNKNVVGSNIAEQERPLYWFIINTPNNLPLKNYKDFRNPQSYAYPDNYFNGYYENPYWAVGTNRDKDQTNRLRGNISASWDVVDNINIIGRLAVNNLSGDGKYYRERQSYNPDLQGAYKPVSPFVIDNESQSTTINGNAVATGNFQLTDNFGLDANLGTSVEMYKYRGSTIRANNLSIPDFFDVSNGTGAPVVNVDQSQQRTFGLFGKAEFNYREWAYLSVTGREDFTSTLPTGDNSYFYPSVGVTFILSDAIPTLQDVSFLSFLKVTANNSTVYKDLSPYQINETFAQSGTFPLGSINGFYLGNTAIDKSIKKEKLNSTEFGINAAFFNSRLTFDGSYYFTQTNNLITNISPSVASASTGYLTNIGQLSGSGVELTLGGDVIESRDFTWNLSVNYTSYEQKVDEIQPGSDEIALDALTGYGTYAIKGEVFPQIKAQDYQRDPQGRVIIDPDTGVPLTGGVTAQGKTTPDYTLGLNTSVNFKGVTVSATMDYRTGFIYYAQGIDQMEFTGRSVESAASNRQAFVFPNSSYKDPNGSGYIANTNIPITTADRTFWTDNYNEVKANYVRDATAFKLRELAVNYSLPAKLLSKTNVISRLSVGLIARNLITVLPNDQSRFSDPEFKNTGYDQNGIGIGGYFSGPPVRTYGFNVNIEF